jgi:hypothetical protein
MMRKKSKGEKDDDLRLEYNLRQLLRTGVQGKYAKRYRQGTNLVLLKPEVARAAIAPQPKLARPLDTE